MTVDHKAGGNFRFGSNFAVRLLAIERPFFRFLSLGSGQSALVKSFGPRQAYESRRGTNPRAVCGALCVESAKADAPTPPQRETAKAAVAVADIGFNEADAPRSPDVTSLEADAASASLARAQLNAAQALIVELPSWIVDDRQASTSVLDGLVAALDRWFAASETASAKPAHAEAREGASTDPADLGLRGFL